MQSKNRRTLLGGRECRNQRCLHRKNNPGRSVLKKQYADTKFISCPHCSPGVAKLVNNREGCDQ